MSLYLLTPCSLEGLQSIYTETDLSGVVGKFISIEESEACYEVSEVEEEPCGETTCDTIQVTYTLVGEEPVTIEVEIVDGEYTIEGVGMVQKIGSEWLVTDGENGLFVAVASSGSGNRIMTSENGIDWTIRTSPANNGWKSVAYGNGLFVAVANSGTNRVMKSTDGITWTTSTESETNTWNSVTFGNGIFVAVAQDGTNQVMTSPDGITWTSRTASGSSPWTSVTFGNNLFVAVASFGGNRIMTSPDGITWTNRTASENNGWQSVTYGNGKYVAVSGNGINQIMYSSNGITWTSVNEPETNNWKSITYGNGKFVAISDNGTNQVMISVDGITWTSETQSLTTTWNAVTFGNGLFVAVSSNDTNRVMTSIDGETWTTRSDAADNTWNAVTYGGLTYATLSEDTPCPFGTYTIEEGSIFESFEVASACTPPPTTDVNLLTCFNTCEDCNKPFYKLTDCKNSYPPIYATDTRLEDHISNIIKIPYYQYSCFSIEKIPFQPGTLATQYVDFSNAYTNCDACEQQDYSEPNFDTCGCPAEKVEKVACTFVDLMYQQMMARRLGIEFCCPIEKEITIIRLRKLENQLLCTETPDFPEPEIVECCIVLPNSCSCQITNCGCTPCEEIATEEIPDCNCSSSGENSPHDCHTYTVTTTTEHLGLATGNTNTALNNKVFFCYFPCKNENPKTVVIKTATEKEYCVLGIPLQGYYANDVFVPITLTRGEICEPPTQTCN